jgi:hypothetical protein
MYRMTEKKKETMKDEGEKYTRIGERRFPALTFGFWLLALFFLPFFSFAQNDTGKVYTSLPEALADPENVYHLDLSKQKLNAFPAEILQLKNLRTLNLYKNKIDSVPSGISQLQNLTELNIGHNKLTVFNPAICQLLLLEKLVLNQNSIESLPADIKNLKNLRYLDMWDNDLWFFPDELAELSETLKELDLQNIQFNADEQARVRALLPKTKINWPPACNCKD